MRLINLSNYHHGLYPYKVGENDFGSSVHGQKLSSRVGYNYFDLYTKITKLSNIQHNNNHWKLFDR